MTIRKISGRTTSLAVKATVTQGGIFKAALQHPTGIQSLQNKSSTLIPKIANVTHRVINHLLYDPEGFGIRHVYDWLSINTDLNFGLGKSLGDSASASDVLISRLVKNREPADAFSTTEQLNFLLRTRRTFDDAAVLLDTPSLGLRKPVADTQSLTDFFFISRVKNFDETITGSDTFGRVFKSYRTFEDTVGMLDAFVFIDGSTFELRRRLYDAVTVNTSEVELVRNAGNSTENFSYVMNKYLDPDMELLDQISKLGLKSITDVDITSADRPFLYTSKPLTDTPTLLDLQPSFVGLKSTTDLVTIGTAAVSGGVTDVGGAAVFTGGPTWQIPVNSAFTYGTNDFTIEFWAYQTGASGVQGIQRTSTGDAAFSSGYCTITMPGQRLNITQGNGAGGYFVISSNTTLALNTWHHYAYVRNAGVCKLYVDGIAQTGTFTNTSSIPAQVGIMQIGNAGGLFTGRLTNFRIVNGTAVYTSNFTPSTSPLTAITNTKLLLLMSSSGAVGVDSGPLNFTLTPTGGGPTYTTSTPLISSTVATTRLSGDTLENFSYWLDKYLTDSSIMLDSMSFGDQLAYDSTKLLSDILTETDRPYLWFAPAVRTEIISLADANRSRFTKANTDSADLTETSTKLFGKNTSNILSLADILNIVRLKDYADVFTTTDLNRFALTKIFADTVEADDPLVRLTDGNISLLIKQRQDTEPVDDYFARAVKYYRYPHHNDGGLGNFVPVLEDDSKYVNLRARAGALTTYPIIRTNLISWSEQFDTNQSGGYWTSIGATVITNATLAPQNVVSSNSTTYDADQLQELFYNKPNNTNYGSSWYQIVPGRWVMSSDGDLLKQDTSNGTHQLSTPNIPELIGTTNFGFSIHLKYAGHRYVRLWVTSFVNVDVDMVNNVVVATSAGKASMQPVGGGWFLVQMENRIVNFGIAPEMQILNEILYNSTNSPYGTYQYKLVPDNIISSARIVLLDNNLNTTFTGNGTDGVYVWGAQLEVGDQPEQEVSSLKYIRTAGGSATRIGFSVTPTDNDRVFVGRIQRRGGQEVRNDPFEVISLLLQYKASVGDNLATPVDYAARSVRYFRDRVTEPGLGDSFAAGNGNSLRRYSNDPLELISFWFNKDAKKAGTSTATRQTVVRQNLLKWSERFDYDYWTKTNVRATTGISVIGGSLPCRNVSYDADQIFGLFYNKKYTYNQGRRWWDVIPLSTATRADFTSNTIVDIFESSSNSIHTVQTFGFATNLSGDFFASSIYASPANGVTRFRLQVGSVFADFDLSSIAVLSSVGTLYNKIVQADTSTGWYLCTIIGPTQALGTLNFTTDAVIPADLLQKLIPFRAAPDSILPTDQRPALFGSKYFADTTTMLSNFYIADGSTYNSNKQLLDSFVAGTAEGFRTSGNTAENVKFLTKFTAHRGGEFTSLTIKLINDVKGSAAKVAEDVFVNRTNKNWFQLAPYYNSSVHLNDYPTDFERVRVGSQSGGVRGSNDPFETINLLLSRFFVNRDSVTTTERKLGNYIKKQIDETKLIPTIPKFDAAAVAGLFYNTTRNIDGRRYTPQDGNYTYYARTDWYSLAPRYARPRFAYGTGNTPGTRMIDNMQLGDSLTYYQNYHLYDNLLIGSPDGVRGTSDNENFSFNLNLRPKRGAFTDLYIAKLRPTKFNADQTLEIFYGSSNNITSYTKQNPFGRRWFQLAPYYASYNHYKDSPGQYDFVRVGSIQGPLKYQGWPTEIIEFYITKLFTDSTTMVDRFDIGDNNVFYDTKAFYETLVLGLPNETRVSGSTLENVSFVNKFVARRSGTTTSTLLSLGSITRTSADQTAEVFDNLRTSTPIINKWYQLAPYYRSRLYDQDSDYDRVRVGSQTLSRRTSSDPYETLSIWMAPKTRALTVSSTDTRASFIRKEFSETRMIPNNPRFDAARVAGLELYSSSSQNINLAAYTPLSGGTQYYRARDWYSEVPLSNLARFARGNAGVGPIMIDTFSFGDVFTYTGSKLLSSIALTAGTQLTSVNLVYQLPTFSISSVLVTSLSQNFITYSENLFGNWTVGGTMTVTPAATGAPNGGLADTLTSLFAGNRISQSLVRPVTSGNFISVSAYVKWTSITSGDLIRFGLAINSSNVTHGVQINVLNQINPTTGVVTYYITQAEPVTPWYRVQFNITAPTRLTVDNTRVVFEHTSGSSVNFAVWGVQIADVLVAPTYRRTTSTVVDTQTIYSYTQISSAVSSTNIGTKYSNDPAETIDVRLNKTAKQGAFTDLYIKNRSISPLDADQVLGLLYNSSNNTRSIIRNNPYRRRWYQLAPYYNSYGHIKNNAQDTDRVLVSYKELFQTGLAKGNNDIVSTTGDGGFRKQTGQLSNETTKFNVQLFARRAALTTSNVVITTKTNWVSYSEDFTGFYWGKTGASAIQAPQLMSGLYPYRNTNFDAVQVANQFLIIGTSSAYTRYNNYYRKAWYTPAPLTNRVAFSSTVLQYLTDQDATSPHYMQAEVKLRDYSIPEEYVTFSLHVQRQSGSRKFRMDVGRCYADFDLSSVSVITSTVTVGYANIRYVDTSAGVFLCQIIAPIQTFPNTLIRFAVSSDTVTAGDSGINFLRRDRRTFDHAVVGTESINNDKITDYHL